MTRRLDDGKRRIWEKRLERFRASGLTVARFCRGEDVSVHTFHYWAKRIRYAASMTPETQGLERSSPAIGFLGARTRLAERSDSAKDDTAMVRFLFDRGVQVSIPADCLEAIRCLVQCVQQSTQAPAGSFHQVIVRDSPREAS